MPCADCQVGAKTCVTADVANSCMSFFLSLQDCQVRQKIEQKMANESHQKHGTTTKSTKIDKSKKLLRILTVAWNLSETLADKSDI